MNEPELPGDGLTIDLASPEELRSWTFAQARRPEMLERRSKRPVQGGLLCESVFGREGAFECPCGLLHGRARAWQTCPQCEGLCAPVRLTRFAVIELHAPVVHRWLHRPLARLLGMPYWDLQKVLYLVEYLVIEPGSTPLRRGQTLTEEQYRLVLRDGQEGLGVGMGGEACRWMLETLRLDRLAVDLRRQLEPGSDDTLSAHQRQRVERRLALVEGLLSCGVSEPADLVSRFLLTALPVLPAGLRPTRKQGGTRATESLTVFYARILNRNNRLAKLIELNAPEIIIRNEVRMLQQCVDALFDNADLKRPVREEGRSWRPLTSLSDHLRGEKGLLRNNLLSKRVDYSARVLAVPDPSLDPEQCGLPVTVAAELYQPFLLGELIRREDPDLAQRAARLAELLKPCTTGFQEPVFRAARPLYRELLADLGDDLVPLLAELMRGRSVLVSRPRALHARKVLAFEPVPVAGDVLRLHPLAAQPLGLSFSGERLPIHLTLSLEAQSEALVLLSPAHVLRSPSDGRHMFEVPADAALGCHLLTRAAEGPALSRCFASAEEVVACYERQLVGPNEPILLRLPREKVVLVGRKEYGSVSLTREADTRADHHATTVGRVLFNEALDARLPFYNVTVDAALLRRILEETHQAVGGRAYFDALRRLTDLGFRAVRQGGWSLALADLPSPADKAEVLARAEDSVAQAVAAERRGDACASDSRSAATEAWVRGVQEVQAGVRAALKGGPAGALVDSGIITTPQARALSGMVGLFSGKGWEVAPEPIRSSFAEGLRPLEYFARARTQRKQTLVQGGREDNARSLLRRLVDAAGDVVVRAHDCGTRNGLTVPAEGRSPLYCSLPEGVCRLCYGTDPATGRLVEEGQAVGVIAAHAIAERVPQLGALRVFQGGVPPEDQGRTIAAEVRRVFAAVEDILEARAPKEPALLSPVAGTVRSVGSRFRLGRRVVIATPDGQEHTCALPPGRSAVVKEGDRVRVGDRLSSGPLNPRALVRLVGASEAPVRLLAELRQTFAEQRLPVEDRHFEIVLARMFRSVVVLHAGDTTLHAGQRLNRNAFDRANERLLDSVKVTVAGDGPYYTGQIVPRPEFEEVARRLQAEGKQQPEGVPPTLALARARVQGISAVVRTGANFLLAAAADDPARALTRAALRGLADPLDDLAGNVILGRLIPAGTGYRPTS